MSSGTHTCTNTHTETMAPAEWQNLEGVSQPSDQKPILWFMDDLINHAAAAVAQRGKNRITFMP